MAQNRKGTISVNTTDIFPIIKKWLYSEHDIFIRELVSNATDAISKRSTLARNANQECPAGKITVEIDNNAKTITFHDNGIGMTEEEVEKYIAQLAFSGAEEFVQKMKDQNANVKDEIIGKFGLGFYSAFMVADKVQVESLSMKEGATPTLWTCDGDTDYEFSASSKTEVGTSIKLFINEDSKDFLQTFKTRETMKRYCGFMPYPVELVDIVSRNKTIEENAKAAKPEDKKEIEVDIINNTEPLWKKDPSTLKDEDYTSFYSELFPMDQAPLFWLHLNIDHPFTLKGILYFPKLNMSKPGQEGSIRLFSKQVFVSDSVKNIIPDFLSLLKGAIDSTDIPLNVSRSALQGDPNIQKISNYIIKKVAESLKKLFNNDRKKYEASWEDIGLFIKYGVVSDTKFDELMRPYVLFKNTDGSYLTLSEYREKIPTQYAEKLKDKFVIFEKDQSDTALRNQLQAQGVPVIETDHYIDPHFMQHLEIHKQGDAEFKFTTIDNEYENLLEASSVSDSDLKIKDFFFDILSKDKKEDQKMDIEVKTMGANATAYLKVDQSMKRFAQMTKSMGQSNFNFPVKKTLVINPSSSLIQNAYKLWEKGDKKDLAEKIAFYVQDLATISSEGLKGEEKDKFVTRSQEILQELSSMVV
jgi:molecular chaperone HtpG